MSDTFEHKLIDGHILLLLNEESLASLGVSNPVEKAQLVQFVKGWRPKTALINVFLPSHFVESANYLFVASVNMNLEDCSNTIILFSETLVSMLQNRNG